MNNLAQQKLASMHNKLPKEKVRHMLEKLHSTIASVAVILNEKHTYLGSHGNFDSISNLSYPLEDCGTSPDPKVDIFAHKISA